MLDPLTPEEQEQTLAAFKARLENPNVKIERFDARKKEWFPHVNYLWDSNEAHRIAEEVKEAKENEFKQQGAEALEKGRNAGLKPCPFCGNQEVGLVKYPRAWMAFCGGGDCSARCLGHSEGAVVTKWQLRVSNTTFSCVSKGSFIPPRPLLPPPPIPRVVKI